MQSDIVVMIEGTPFPKDQDLHVILFLIHSQNTPTKMFCISCIFKEYQTLFLLKKTHLKKNSNKLNNFFQIQFSFIRMQLEMKDFCNSTGIEPGTHFVTIISTLRKRLQLVGSSIYQRMTYPMEFFTLTKTFFI